MRFSKRRKITEPMARLNLYLRETTRQKLDQIAGPHALGHVVEALIEREARRREKKAQEACCTANSAIDIESSC